MDIPQGGPPVVGNMDRKSINLTLYSYLTLKINNITPNSYIKISRLGFSVYNLNLTLGPMAPATASMK